MTGKMYIFVKIMKFQFNLILFLSKIFTLQILYGMLVTFFASPRSDFTLSHTRNSI